MKKLLFIVALAMAGTATTSQAQHRYYADDPTECRVMLSRQRAILNDLREDLAIERNRLQHASTIWSPRIREYRMRQSLQKIHLLEEDIADTKEIIRKYERR